MSNSFIKSKLGSDPIFPRNKSTFDNLLAVVLSYWTMFPKYMKKAMEINEQSIRPYMTYKGKPRKSVVILRLTLDRLDCETGSREA